MAGVGRLDGVDAQSANRVDAQRVDFWSCNNGCHFRSLSSRCVHTYAQSWQAYGAPRSETRSEKTNNTRVVWLMMPSGHPVVRGGDSRKFARPPSEGTSNSTVRRAGLHVRSTSGQHRSSLYPPFDHFGVPH